MRGEQGERERDGRAEGGGEKMNMALLLPLSEPSEGRWSKA